MTRFSQSPEALWGSRVPGSPPLCSCRVTAEAAVDIISAIAPAVVTALKAVVNVILVPSPCGILEVLNRMFAHADFPLVQGFYPLVKIAGRYRAKASTDKQKIDLSVNVRLFVNIRFFLARHSCL